MSIIYADKIAPYLQVQKTQHLDWVEIGRISIKYLSDQEKDHDNHIKWLDKQKDDPKQSIKLYKARLRLENGQSLSKVMAMMAIEIEKMNRGFTEVITLHRQAIHDLEQCKMNLHTVYQMYKDTATESSFFCEMIIKKIPEPSYEEKKEAIRKNLPFWTMINDFFKGDYKF